LGDGQLNLSNSNVASIYDNRLSSDSHFTQVWQRTISALSNTIPSFASLNSYAVKSSVPGGRLASVGVDGNGVSAEVVKSNVGSSV
jgi:hypothetical protein